MALKYTQPHSGLERELREVARDAAALINALTTERNFDFSPDFPKNQLIDIARSLAQLPSGTAEGSRPSLEYARDRLPAIRRAHILSEELDLSRSDADTAPPVLRGALIDQRLRDLIASVTTALDEYRRQASVEPPKEATPQEAISAPSKLTEEAVARSSLLESQLKPSSQVSPPPDFDWDKVYEMIVAGIAPPEPWRPFIDHLRLTVKDRKTEIVNLIPISDLTNVDWLDLWRSPVSDISPVSGLKKLKFLNLGSTRVSDLSALAKLTRLKKLHLNETRVSDVSALASLKSLKTLDLSGTSVSDISALASLTKLEMLDLTETLVSDISALASMINLKDLKLDGTQITNVAPLSSLKALNRLSLANTPVRSIAPLSRLRVARLDLEGTLIKSVSVLKHMPLLSELWIGRTQVWDLRPLRELIYLQYLDTTGSLVTDISPLNHMPDLDIEGAHTRRSLKRSSIRKRK
jgi:hypothetical protein